MTQAAIVVGELAGLDVELGDLAGIDGHGQTLCASQNQSCALDPEECEQDHSRHDEAADAEDQEVLLACRCCRTSQPKFWPKKPVTTVQTTKIVPPIVSRVATALSRSELALK